jgi:threonine aldolase
MHVDLRSDTVTKPTKAMLEAMVSAELGDDVFGEDPTANNFELKIAEHFGFEAGLFVPSGVMSNQLALMAQTQKGEEIIIDELGHIFNYETAAASTLSNIQIRPLKGANGKLTEPIIRAAIRTKNHWDPITSMICLEQTTNKGGGAYYQSQELSDIAALAKESGLILHIDGARVWNALHESDTEAKDYANWADSMSVCFSKGLGAPVGSMLLSSKKVIDKARRFRKMIGGGMRQIGLLAAAADYAFEHHFPLLKQDHIRAKTFAKAVSENAHFSIDVATVHTNIVIFDTLNGMTAQEALLRFQEFTIFMVAFGPNTIRATFHHQITDEQFSHVLSTLKSF